jgi:hypothetical protein
LTHSSHSRRLACLMVVIAPMWAQVSAAIVFPYSRKA